MAHRERRIAVALAVSVAAVMVYGFLYIALGTHTIDSSSSDPTTAEQQNEDFEKDSKLGRSPRETPVPGESTIGTSDGYTAGSWLSLNTVQLAVRMVTAGN